MGPNVIPKKKNWFARHKVITVFLVLIVLIGAAIGGGVIYSGYWYQRNIQPRSDEHKRLRVTVEPGTSAVAIGKQLAEKEVIRSAKAFQWYVDRNNARESLQAGTYLFSPDQSVAEIVQMLVDGDVDQFRLTITPGQRLADIRQNLIEAGFDEKELDAALDKKYDFPLFAGKPATADLEGYIFPETYEISSETTPEQFLTKTFAVFYEEIKQANILEGIAAQDLSLFEAITLGSIVQLEVSSPEDQAKVAQVFLRRLGEDISLGADPTFKYAAFKEGVEPRVDIDSPYNTRIYKGLPPGPIANMNLSALKAVAFPADTDFLYFVAGDDGTTHFSHTQEEHDRLTEQYCTELCQ